MTVHDQDSAEFDAAFKEAAAAIRGSQPTAPVPAPPTEEPAPLEEAPAPAPEEPAPEPPPEDEREQLRRQIKELEHRERSASSRVSAFHKKLNQVTSELEALRANQAAAPAAAPDEDDPELKALMDEMPEVAKLVNRLVDGKVGQRVAQVEQRVEATVKPFREDAERQAVKAELATVEQEFPNWSELVYSQPFQSWKDTLPPAMRTAWDNASTGADALAFLRMYRNETSPPAAPAPSASPAASRQDKLAKAVGLPSRNSLPTQSGAPAAEDFDGNFEYFAKQMRRT